jgi:outer membrane protein TolC
MKRLSFSMLLAAALLPLSAFAQQAAPPGPRRRVSLREALQLAAKQGPDVAAARAEAAIVHASVNKAYTAWQPDVTVNGTYDHTNGTADFDFRSFTALFPPGFINPATLPPPVTLTAQNNWYGNAQLTQPLLTPQGLFGPGAAKAAAEAADRGADEAREQVLLGVARAYLGLQGLYGLLDAAKEAENVALRREQDAKARIAAGTDVELGLLRAQTETAAARTLIAQYEGQIEGFTPLLEALTGEPIEPLPPGAPYEMGPISKETDQPWEGSYTVKSAASAVIAADRARNLSKFAWLPTVAGIAKENYTSNGGFVGKNWTYDLMINVSIPIYDRGLRYAQGREDEAKIAQAQAQLAAARARAKSNWIGAAANLVSAQAVLEQSTAQYQVAAKAQTQTDVAVRAGVATSLDLSVADQQKFAAQGAAVQAKAALEIRKAELAAAEGRLYSLSSQ